MATIKAGYRSIARIALVFGDRFLALAAIGASLAIASQFGALF